jgi:hypothetical protein
MKLARVMTSLTLVVSASWVMGGVAFADLVCDETADVNVQINCEDGQFGTGYEAIALASTSTVTVTLNNGDGSPVRADTGGFDAQGNQVARAITVDPGGSDTDSKGAADGDIATHDLLLFAG